MGLFDMFARPDINAKVVEARNTPNAVVLDVRTREEYARGHIEGATNVPLNEIERAATLYAGKRLYVHCAGGARAERAVTLLKGLGFETAQSIGGLSSWTGPVVTGEGPAPRQ